MPTFQGNFTETEKAYIVQWTEAACQANGHLEVSESISFSFNSRRRSVYGMAYYGGRRVEISKFLWDQIQDIELKKRMVQHEVCHILSFVRFGMEGVGHNAKWRHCCYQAGYVPERLTNLGIPNATWKQKKYKASCPCGWVKKVTANKRARYLHGAEYVCQKCHGDVTIHDELYQPVVFPQT